MAFLNTVCLKTCHLLTISFHLFFTVIFQHQRDPRLNTILYPLVTSEQAKGLMTKYGKDSGMGICL